MNQPSPAIVTQSAVRRLPRVPLLMMCTVYVLLGFVGRDPWRGADVDGFGRMWDMAQRNVHWLRISSVDVPHAPDAPLAYALGALSIDAFPWLPSAWAARLPFIAMLALTLAAAWYAVYDLARLPRALPVSFAFGGEAKPRDYARAMADAGLLALLACLGLPVLTHETTPALAQLCATTLMYLALALMLRRKPGAYWLYLGATLALALCGAPTLAILLGLGSAFIVSRESTVMAVPSWALPHDPQPSPIRRTGADRSPAVSMLIGLALVAMAATAAALWRWRLQPWSVDLASAKGMGRLMLWFGWPATPLAIWTVWRWRRQLLSAHLALPLWFLLVVMGTTLLTPAGERSLLLGLPALATLAAFALPTLRRSVSSLIDWFTLLFFTGGALVLWIIWLSLEFGIPAKPAQNIMRLMPDYVHHSPLWAVLIAGACTYAWCWLVHWRVGRHPSVIWKSLVLPAAGTTLGWVLISTLLLSPLDHGQSHAALTRQVVARLGANPGCVLSVGVSAGLQAALRENGHIDLREASGRPAARAPSCRWLVQRTDNGTAPPAMGWRLVAANLKGPRGGEQLSLFERAPHADIASADQ